MKNINRFGISVILKIPCNRELYGIFSIRDVIKFLVKVIPCPHCPARSQAPFGFSKKSPRLASLRVVFFRKNLAGQDTELKKTKN